MRKKNPFPWKDTNPRKLRHAEARAVGKALVPVEPLTAFENGWWQGFKDGDAADCPDALNAACFEWWQGWGEGQIDLNDVPEDV